MTLKQEVHARVEALPEESDFLREICEKLRLDQMLKEASDDLANDRILDSESFLREVAARWPSAPR